MRCRPTHSRKTLAAACGEQRRQQMTIVVLGDRLMDETDAALIEHLAIFVLGIDDYKSLLVITEMTFDQRQGAFADRTKADQYDGPVDTGMHWPFRHRQRLQGRQVISWLRQTEQTPGNTTRRQRHSDRNYAAEAARHVCGIRLLGARSRPRAPVSDPGTSSRASSRSRSNGPGMRRAAVFSVEKPKRL